MTYFREVSDLLYQSQLPNRNSSYDFVKVKNLFRRAKIREDFFQSLTVFTKYKIIGEERPEQVAEKVYGSSEFDWVVLISNNIINVRTEWPMSEYDFNQYLFRKYTQEELYEAHHWETTALFDTSGKLIVPAGKIVDEDFSVQYYDAQDSINLITEYPVREVTNFEYETLKNDSKRNIYLLRPRFLQTAVDDMKEIMSYGFSSQYIDEKTKKGDNLRIITQR